MVSKSGGAQDTHTRNSSIELLRIIAMIMIVAFHFICLNSSRGWLITTKLGISKTIFYVIFLGGGWIGNIIFFTISVWFLADRTPTLRQNCKRVWLLEREVLFWSLLLSLVGFFASKKGLIPHFTYDSYIDAFFPLSRDVWWYATSYALFILFSTFLIPGLKALGKRLHGQLVIVVLVLWGIGTLLPGIRFDIARMNVFIMIFWFIPITYYKWYMKPFNTRQCWLLIISGESIYLAYWLFFNILTMLTGHGQKYQDFVFDNCEIAPMLIAFGIFLLFERVSFHSSIINFLANSTFAVYLIHEHPIMEHILWVDWFDIRKICATGFPILVSLGIVVTVFCVCLLADMPRRALFAITCNRNRGHWFDLIWNSISIRFFNSSNKNLLHEDY